MNFGIHRNRTMSLSRLDFAGIGAKAIMVEFCVKMMAAAHQTG
jgi:hypothetical protein